MRRDSMETEPSRSSISLQNCLEKFIEREQLGADNLWYCSRCKDRLQVG